MSFFKRILVVFLSVIILSVSVGGSFFSTKNISRVYAGEFAAAAAGEAAWEWIVAFLASLGLGATVVHYKDALIESYADYMHQDYQAKKEILEWFGDSAMNLYDSASGAVRSVPWDEYIEILKDGAQDYDPLTGIYAQYSPYLIDGIKGYASALINGDIVVDGLSSVFSGPLVSESVIKQQWTGESFNYVANFKYTVKNSSGQINTNNYDLSCISNIPACGLLVPNGNGYQLSFHSIHNGVLVSINMKGTLTAGTYTQAMDNVSAILARPEPKYPDVFSFSYAFNFPLFLNRVQAESYLKTGVLDGAQNVIDNDDLPLWDIWSKLWERVAEATDFGIGSFGVGVGVNDWADDIPFVGLDDLRDYVDDMQDVFDEVRDGIIDIDDPAIDDSISDAWDDVIDDSISSDDVVDGSKDKDMDKDKDKDKDDSIDTPIDETIDIPEVVPDIANNFSDISVDLKNKFPFSLPWDIYYLFIVLADTPKTPYYEIPFVYERLGFDEKIVIDLSDFETLSKLSRLFFSLLYAYGLINWTVKIVSVRKEE